MSLILDALNRAEHERKNQNAVPDLNTLHHPQPLNAVVPARPMLWLAVAAALVLVAIVLVLVIVLRPEPVASSASVVQTSASSAAAIAVQQASPAPSQAAVVQSAPQSAAVAVKPAVAIEAKPATQRAVASVSAAPKVAAPKADIDKLYAAEDSQPVETAERGVNELYAAEAATTAASESIVDPFNPAAAHAVTATAVQEQAPPRTFDSIKNIPDFNALPWNMRQQIPTISYARHNYLAGGVSSVVINNQTTGVGNIIGAGQFIVQEIFVDGVVLKHGNAVFKLRALTGWINM